MTNSVLPSKSALRSLDTRKVRSIIAERRNGSGNGMEWKGIVTPLGKGVLLETRQTGVVERFALIPKHVPETQEELPYRFPPKESGFIDAELARMLHFDVADSFHPQSDNTKRWIRVASISGDCCFTSMEARRLMKEALTEDIADLLGDSRRSGDISMPIDLERFRFSGVSELPKLDGKKVFQVDTMMLGCSVLITRDATQTTFSSYISEIYPRTTGFNPRIIVHTQIGLSAFPEYEVQAFIVMLNEIRESAGSAAPIVPSPQVRPKEEYGSRRPSPSLAEIPVVDVTFKLDIDESELVRELSIGSEEQLKKKTQNLLRRSRLMFCECRGIMRPVERDDPALSEETREAYRIIDGIVLKKYKEKRGALGGIVLSKGAAYLLFSGAPETLYEKKVNRGGYSDEEVPSQLRFGATTFMDKLHYNERMHIELPDGRQVWLIPLR